MTSTLLTSADNVHSLDALRDAGSEYIDPAAHEELEQMVNRVAVPQLMQTLSGEHYHVIGMLFFECKSTREVGKVFDVSHTEIQRLRDEALAQMRKFLEVS